MSHLRRWLNACSRVNDNRRFSREREDYYIYLSALLRGLQGSRTLKDIFRRDAQRYGSNTQKGRLAREWLQRYQASGGDLYWTWKDCLPKPELTLLRTAQAFGNAALVNALDELAKVVRMNRDTAGLFSSVLWSAGVGLLVVLIMLAFIPWLTVPRLMMTFEVLPPDYYGHATQRLLAFSDLIRVFYIPGLVFIVALMVLLLRGLPSMVGFWRTRLDHYGIWRIYRDLHALRFFSLLGVLLDRQLNASTQLRTALLWQKAGMSAWHAFHVDRMLQRIDAGVTGAATFDTGLLGKDMYWYLSDMVMARGLHAGIVLSTRRLHQRLTVVVARQAAVWRWGLLLSCLGVLMGLALWHYAVIDELRRSLMFFYGSH
jgi:hypothetical protein